MPYLNCLYCGKEFYTRPYNIKRGFGKYCSKICSNTHNNPALSYKMSEETEQLIIKAYMDGASKREAGEMFGYGRGATEKLLKKHGISARTVSQALKGRVFSEGHKQKIRDSHTNVSGENNPMFGVTSPNPNGYGKRTYLEQFGINFRSTWEAKIALILTELRIPFEYETRRIMLSDCSTLVDFYLPSIDTYLEVKGYVNSHFRQIVIRMKEEKPNLKYRIVYKEQYTEILKTSKALLKLLT